ncbi:MAG: exopolysaccharide biosynthesis protein, partial [Candidatus Competibacteraceae bacterium]|nr:exopolysaccharide biosynthesis protein [Candidatus Competibacteraceae bacterium]
GQSLAMLEERLHQNVQTSSTLTDLQRKHQVATAVFTSALAKLDLGKTDPFASYPLVQTLALPSQPAGPDTLKRKLALLGAVVGSLSTLIGLGLAWQRQAFFRKILKNA